jgi:AcrR family transcriptional regulator
MAATSPDKTSTASRRTQSERSEAMRLRLVEATLSCLETEGYAGTTVSKIVERAKVSRGAPVHHFPTKASLIEAAAEALVRRIYVELGHAIIDIGDAEDRMAEIIVQAWRAVFGARENAVLVELMVASRHDEELAAIMLKLWTAGFAVIRTAADHYFDPVSEQDNVGQLMVLTQWLLRGMSMDRHLIRDEHVFEHFLRLWSRVLASHMRARTGITTPPPRPEFWDKAVADLGD